MDSDAITSQQVTRAMEALGAPRGSRVAVAVSGGADSTALLLLLKQDFKVTALTVDHGLRPASAGEAQSVADLCTQHSVPHTVLVWSGDKPSSNIQAEARTARYDLLSNYCADHEIRFLAAAHHRDDQAETVLLRLARGSGVYGLAGMAPTRDLDGVKLVRPLLDYPKQVLVDYLEAHSVAWTEDPSNRSHAYDRVKIRQLLANPPVEGLQSQRLAATARRLRRSREALEYYETQWLRDFSQAFDAGYAVLSAEALSAVPEEIMLRGVASLCRFAGNGTYVPRMEKLQHLVENMQQADFAGQTLFGAQINPTSDGGFLFCREWARTQEAAPLTDCIHWDNRFQLLSEGEMDGLEVRALGADGWAQVKKYLPNEGATSLPYIAVLSLPAIYSASGLQAVPHLGYNKVKYFTVTVTPSRLLLTKK